MTRFVAVVLGFVLLAGCGKTGESVDRGKQNEKDADATRPGVVSVGQNIDIALKLMAPMGDGSPMLEMATGDPDLEMKMWAVGKGVLIAIHSRKDRSIRSLSFYMSDERPKALRKTFEYEVLQYFPETKEMRIVVPHRPDAGDGK